jgi:resolvase-like protein
MQSIQVDALEKAECEQIFQEKFTGKLRERPELSQCLPILRKGEALVIWKLDRLARSLKDLVDIVQYLHDREIGFKSLTEAIDTTSSDGRLVFHIFGALAEFEHDLILERTKAGLQAARARCLKGGRKQHVSRITPVKQNQAVIRGISPGAYRHSCAHHHPALSEQYAEPDPTAGPAGPTPGPQATHFGFRSAGPGGLPAAGAWWNRPRPAGAGPARPQFIHLGMQEAVERLKDGRAELAAGLVKEEVFECSITRRMSFVPNL